MSITPECYSGILVKNTPSFRKGLGVGYICCFLRFTFSFTFLIPCLLPPREEREKTERTTAQLPANKKCVLLRFALAIGCLVLADFPASSLPVTLVHPELPFPFLLAVLLCGIPETLVAFWGALCGSARESLLASTPYPLHFTPKNRKILTFSAILFAHIKKMLYICGCNPVHALGLCL